MSPQTVITFTCTSCPEKLVQKFANPKDAAYAGDVALEEGWTEKKGIWKCPCCSGYGEDE